MACGLDPARPTRKFNEQKLIEDPSVIRKELEDMKAANRLTRVKEVDEDMEKIKQKRIEERKMREEQYVVKDLCACYLYMKCLNFCTSFHLVIL